MRLSSDPVLRHPLNLPLSFALQHNLTGSDYLQLYVLIAAMNPLLTTDPDLLGDYDADRPIPQGSYLELDATQYANGVTIDMSSVTWMRIGVWFKILSGVTNKRILSVFHSGSFDDFAIYISDAATGSVGFRLDDGTAVSGATDGTTNYLDGAWHYASGYFDGVNATLTVDSEVVVFAADFTFSTGSGELVVGRYKNEAAGSVGGFKDVTVETNNGSNIFPLEHNGLDRTDNNNHLTLVNSPVFAESNLVPTDSANDDGYTVGTGSNGAPIGDIIPAHATDLTKDALGNDLQYRGSAYPAKLKLVKSNARSFDWTQYVLTSVTTSQSGAYRAWFNTSVVHTGYICGYHGVGRCYFALSGVVLAGGIGNHSLATIKGSTNVVDGEWHYGELEWDGSTVTLKVDGSIEYQGSQSGTPETNREIDIGARVINPGTHGDTPFSGKLCSVEVPIDGTQHTFPLAEGAGSVAYCTDGVSHGLYVNNSLNELQDVVPSNHDKGFSLYEHATLDPIRIPYGDDGKPLSITPPAGYTKTSDNPPNPIGHNGAETKLSAKVATDGGYPPAIAQATPAPMPDWTHGDTLTPPLYGKAAADKTDRLIMLPAPASGDDLANLNKYLNQ